MQEMSRRKLLAGGAMGALVAMGVKPPSSWSWSPAGSVIGAGAGADPRWVWDALADPVVANVIESGQTKQVNELLAKWTKNDQPLPAGLPQDLHDFIEQARRLPEWHDADKMQTAFAFNEKRGLYLGLTYGLASGMMSTGIPREARAVYYSKGGADMKDRIAKTAKLGYDIGTRNAFDPGGEMVVTCVKTRLAHAGVRHLLPQSPHWVAQADEDIPISQRDIMVTWHSLPSTVWRHFKTWEIAIPDDEAEAFLHSWQVTAHMLGVEDEYIPATWDDAEAQCQQVLDPLLAATPEGIKLAEILMNLAAEIDAGLASKPFIAAVTRYLLGDEFADMMKIPRYRAMDAFIENAWPPFVAVREGAMPLPLAPQGYWAIDEFIRQFVLFFLSEGQPINIEIPDTNNPNYG